MRKILYFVFTVCFAITNTVSAAPRKTNFSLNCERPATNCTIIGDKSSIKTIENCDTPTSWEPAAGQVYLISQALINECDKIKKVKCDKTVSYIHNNIDNTYEVLLSCAEDTSYDIIYYGNEDDVSDITGSYQERVCRATGGNFNKSTNTCTCPSDTEPTENGCMCKYGTLYYLKPGRSSSCAEIPSGCTASGGKFDENSDPMCKCPTSLNLIPTQTNSGCVCKTGYVWKNPQERQLGCIKEGETFDINITVKSSNGNQIVGAQILYDDEQGNRHTATTDSNGKFKLSNAPNTSYIKIIADNHIPATFSAITLSAKTEIVLKYIAPEDKGLHYQACLLQPENPRRSASGIQAKSDSPTNNNWLYCGGFSSERDCSNNSRIIGADNIIYKCTIDSDTKVGTWTPIDIQELKTCMWGGASGIFCGPPDSFEYILHEAENKIIALQSRLNVSLSDGNNYKSYARGIICYEDVSSCSIPNKISCKENICNKLDDAPRWGNQHTQPSPPESTTEYDDTDIATSPATCEDSGGTLSEDGTTCKCDSASGLSANTDNTLCECINSNMTFNTETKKCTISTDDVLDNFSAQNTKQPKHNDNERLKQAESNLKLAKETEQSLANRALGAATTAATGLGLMTAASARAEQRADADAEQDMNAYLATFRCEYGRGQNVRAGNEEITLPGGNELLAYYSEYKSLADNLKNTKKALGLRPGIEQEIVYDKAQSNLYKYSSTGITSGAFTSLSRALTDAESADAAAWNAQKEKSAQNLKTGLIAAGAGIVGGIAGNYLINKDVKYQELKQDFEQAEQELIEEHPDVLTPPQEEPTEPTEPTKAPEEEISTLAIEPIVAQTIDTPQILKPTPQQSLKLDIPSVSGTAFDSGDFVLNDKGKEALDAIVNKISELLNKPEHSKAVISIKTIGHTDMMGISAKTKKAKGYSTNTELSEKRAQSVIDYLTNGLQSFGTRVKNAGAYGHGEKWCRDNDKPKDSADCRRVDIDIKDLTLYN